MVDLPREKVGIIACSGEELPEGTITRLAALKVLEQLRPDETVTLCLPLFLAGGEGERAFAKFYPTIAVDGCELRCAARATEKYSSKPAAGLVIRDLIAEHGLDAPAGLRRLNAAGQQAVALAAEEIVAKVDALLAQRWDRHTGRVVSEPHEAPATCSCGSGIPIQTVYIAGRPVTLVGLPIFFQRCREAGKAPSPEVDRELLGWVKIYNAVSVEEEAAMLDALRQEYAAFWDAQP